MSHRKGHCDCSSGVSYYDGIALEDGDRIPPFSEIHRLALVKVEGTWRVSAQDIA